MTGEIVDVVITNYRVGFPIIMKGDRYWVNTILDYEKHGDSSSSSIGLPTLWYNHYEHKYPAYFTRSLDRSSLISGFLWEVKGLCYPILHDNDRRNRRI